MGILDWFKLRTPFLGVDVGRSSIKVVRLAPSARGMQLMHASLVELEEAEPGTNGSPLKALSELFGRENSLPSARLATLFTGRNLMIRYLSLPKMPQGELREAVRWEAKKHASLPVEELVIDFLVIGETQEKDLKRSEVMLVMAERALVQKQMEEFHRSGIKISALDVNHLVLLNTLRHHRSGDLTENLVYVDIGAGKLDIGIVKRGILRFTRTVQTGGNDITQAIQQELQVGFGVAERMKRELGLLSKEGLPANRLMDGQGQSGLVGGETAPRLHQVIKGGVDRFVVEVQRSVDYYRAQFHEGAVQRLLLMGGVVLMPGFLEYFSSYFDARVEIDDPFSGIRCGDRFSKDLKAMAPRFASGIGLALRKA